LKERALAEKIPDPKEPMEPQSGNALFRIEMKIARARWSERPNWALYRNLPVVPLREAVALSLNLPPSLIEYLEGYGSDFDERISIAIAHMSEHGELRHVAVANPIRETRVRLADIAHLAEFCTPKWRLPREFPGAALPVPVLNAGALYGVMASLGPAFPQSDDSGLPKRERQIIAILAAIAAMNYNPLEIPTGGKKLLRNHCKELHPDLFGAGSDPFDGAWKAARACDPERVRMADHSKFATK
jgi:hypothetical protein